MKKIGIISKRGKEQSIKTAGEVARWLSDRGVEVWLEDHSARELGWSNFWTEGELPDSTDMIVVLGGDGTLLYASRLLERDNVPVLGVNLGDLGFLTEVGHDQLYTSLEKVLEDKYTIERRMRLNVFVRKEMSIMENRPTPPFHGKSGATDFLEKAGGESRYCVLNDVVIGKREIARLINIETFIGEEYLATFKADGIILSTPTGSTAYSMAAGGPIIHPDLSTIILTPICPHVMTNRSFVVSSDVPVRVVVESGKGQVMLTLDGQIGLPLTGRCEIEVKRSEQDLRVIGLRENNYFNVLRTKLKW